MKNELKKKKSNHLNNSGHLYVRYLMEKKVFQSDLRVV